MKTLFWLWISEVKQRERWRPRRREKHPEVRCLAWWKASVSHNESEVPLYECVESGHWQRERTKKTSGCRFLTSWTSKVSLLKVPYDLIIHVEVARGTGSVLLHHGIVWSRKGNWVKLGLPKQSHSAIRAVSRATSKSLPMPEKTFNDLSSYDVEVQK